ncbi:hypothetical protein N7470_000115 [Penicillium chermesinum]|nr:hypothetical protein N7470_000115 [Penicillium chermesinum]
MAFPFRVVEHVVPCQHIREYPGATADSQEDVLQLAVKQYIPLDNENPQPGDVTILAAHANGFPKELYEPLWEEIHARSKDSGFRIRSIWMADVAHQGESSVLNEHALGNDPSWFDHPRDLLHLVNVKRAEMPRPIVGLGHSFGGAQLTQLSLMHPRLLHTLVLLDPVIQPQPTTLDDVSFEENQFIIAKTTQLSTYRREIWPSRKAAEESFQRSPFYQAWDPRVLKQWVKYGLRDLPTALHPLDDKTKIDPANPPVTLRTPLHQEVFTFSRPNYTNIPGNGKPVNRVTHPDLELTSFSYPFYRPEPTRIFHQLPFVRPSVLYIFGGKSDLSLPQKRADKLANTGTGTLAICLPEEAVTECADAAASWIGPELRRWKDENESFRAEWDKKTKREKMAIDADWLKHVPAPARRPQNGNGSPSKL